MEVKIQHRKHITLVPTSLLTSALPRLIGYVIFVLGCIMNSTRALHFSPFERSSFLVSLSQLMAPSSCLVLKPWSYLWCLSLPLTSSIQYISKSCGLSFQNGTQVWALLTTSLPHPDHPHLSPELLRPLGCHLAQLNLHTEARMILVLLSKQKLLYLICQLKTLHLCLKIKEIK